MRPRPWKTVIPMKLRDFIGNRRLVSLLHKGRVPPTALFSGPEGVGKKTLALSLAMRANCRTPESGEACQTCSSCHKALTGQHPDVRLIDREWLERFAKSRKRSFNPQVIPIEVARELVREAQFRPYEGKLRFFIIDEAEKLNEPAANAMLKTLEEPPEATHFVLVTPYPESLLETVRSRCQQFLFQALSRQEIRSYLERQGESEAELRSALAGGSIGRARSLDLERERADRGQMAKLLAEWSRQRSFARLFLACEGKHLRQDLKNRERVLELLAVLRTVVQDCYFLGLGQPERVANTEQLELLEEAARHCPLDWLRKFLYHIDEARLDVKQYVQPLMSFEALWLKSLEDAGDRPSQV